APTENRCADKIDCPNSQTDLIAEPVQELIGRVAKLQSIRQGERASAQIYLGVFVPIRSDFIAESDHHDDEQGSDREEGTASCRRELNASLARSGSHIVRLRSRDRAQRKERK